MKRVEEGEGLAENRGTNGESVRGEIGGEGGEGEVVEEVVEAFSLCEWRM